MTTPRNKLVLTTPSDLEIKMEREFNAPRDLIFEAFTKPEHVRQWWGPCALMMTVCDMDVRVGGDYRYELQAEDGSISPFKGTYREITPPSKLVYTFIYDVEPYNSHTAVVTIAFDDLGGRTKMTEVILCESNMARDGILGSGMEYGATMSMDQLEDLLARLQGTSA
jgi:uncharacterized protein YndB with AHSA1/START domain